MIAALVCTIIVAIAAFFAAFLVNSGEVSTSSAVAFLLTCSDQEAAGIPGSLMETERPSRRYEGIAKTFVLWSRPRLIA